MSLEYLRCFYRNRMHASSTQKLIRFECSIALPWMMDLRWREHIYTISHKGVTTINTGSQISWIPGKWAYTFSISDKEMIRATMRLTKIIPNLLQNLSNTKNHLTSTVTASLVSLSNSHCSHWNAWYRLWGPLAHFGSNFIEIVICICVNEDTEK